MKKSVELCTQRAHHPRIPVANIDAADAAAKVNEAIAIHVFEH